MQQLDPHERVAGTVIVFRKGQYTLREGIVSASLGKYVKLQALLRVERELGILKEVLGRGEVKW